MHGALTTFNIHSSASASVFRLFVFSGYWHKGFENLVAYDHHVVFMHRNRNDFECRDAERRVICASSCWGCTVSLPGDRVLVYCRERACETQEWIAVISTLAIADKIIHACFQ
jgi:hypothetical protein